MRSLIFMLLGLVATASAHPSVSSRIYGGTTTTINSYPDMVSLLASHGPSGYRQSCGGVILNNRSVMTAAHCTILYMPNFVRSRVGSTYANSGGHVHFTNVIFNHPQFSLFTLDNDIAVVRTLTEIMFSNVVRAARIAGPLSVVPDNAVVWATGWGLTETGRSSEILRHVQIYSINQHICRQRYAMAGTHKITDNMLCSGVLDVGGRDQCNQDSGGPLYYNGVVVGVCSFGPPSCGHPFFPGVNARVARYTSWISQLI